MSSIRFSTITELRSLLQSKKITPNELIKETYNNFLEYDKNIKSAVEVFDHAHSFNFQESSLLSCIPYLNKDVICYKDKTTACCSKMLSNYIAPYNAHVIERLNHSGAICMGRGNCDEFAMGSSTETSFYHNTYNPWDTTRVPGGSSGGSAAAVAAGLVPFALGTETGGSVRQPASLCGIVGLKPTYGLLSRRGVIAYASSLDQVGIFSRNVYDNALVASTLAGKDSFDSTSRAPFTTYDYTKTLTPEACKGKKIAYIDNSLNHKDIDPRVKEKLEAALDELKKCGATVEKVTLKTMEYAAATYFIISRAEAASNLARFDGVKYGYRTPEYTSLDDMYCKTRAEGFGANVKRRILVGKYVLSEGFEDQHYPKAQEVRTHIRNEFKQAFQKYDALFAPVTPKPAFKVGEINTNSLEIDLQDYFTAAANLAGICGLAIPCGFVDNLPVGFQLLGDEFCEQKLFEIGHAYQCITDWHIKKPK